MWHKTLAVAVACLVLLTGCTPRIGNGYHRMHPEDAGRYTSKGPPPRNPGTGLHKDCWVQLEDYNGHKTAKTHHKGRFTITIKRSTKWLEMRGCKDLVKQ